MSSPEEKFRNNLIRIVGRLECMIDEAKNSGYDVVDPMMITLVKEYLSNSDGESIVSLMNSFKDFLTKENGKMLKKIKRKDESIIQGDLDKFLAKTAFKSMNIFNLRDIYDDKRSRGSSIRNMILISDDVLDLEVRLNLEIKDAGYIFNDDVNMNEEAEKYKQFLKDIEHLWKGVFALVNKCYDSDSNLLYRDFWYD
ncbi:MAG: hypothetical protein O2U61_05285 [Candidatus Bathyarchaeota archaeon]|nr:hypothetical protein [Candidatus Bathyarchaeota archaeon]